MSDWAVSQSSQLLPRAKEEKTLNSPLCFSDKAPDVLDLCCYGSSGEEHIFKCFECFFPLILLVLLVQSSNHSLIKSPSECGLAFFVILQEITKLVLTSPSLDV